MHEIGGGIMQPGHNLTDLGNLLKDVPEGDWVVISLDGTKVLAHGPNLDKVREAAPHGTITRKFTVNLILQET